MRIARHSPDRLSAWCGGVWSAPPRFDVAGVHHDTRTLKPGDLYLALRGASFDGHDFVRQAVERGAAGVIVDRPCPEAGACPQLLTDGTMGALHALARGARTLWQGTVIGITGSVGKTTVKEMTSSILARKGTVARTPGNRNNDIGLPLSMVQADPSSDFFVFELGMNRPGEIGALAALLRPDWGIITDIGKAHLGPFGTVERIAEEKAALLDHARCAVLDETSEWFDYFTGRFEGTIVCCAAQPFTFRLFQPGTHMVRNARRAVALAREFGLTDPEIQEGLDRFHPGPMRWEVSQWHGAQLINDAYNANPESMRAALQTLAETPCEGRRIAILGPMLELGSSAEEEHRALGRWIDGLPIDHVLTTGAEGSMIRCRCGRQVSREEGIAWLANGIRRGDQVLFKASRGERLEEWVRQLMAGTEEDLPSKVGSRSRH